MTANSRTRLRWSVLLMALAITLGAIFYPVDERFEIVTPTGQPTRQQESNVSPTFTPSPSTIEWVATTENPFSPRDWQAPPPPVEPERVVQAVTVADAAPSPPPVLPYAFVGQMSDDGDQVVYLNRGEQLLLARAGEVLEGTHKVIRIDTAQIEFETVATGVRQSLKIPSQVKQ